MCQIKINNIKNLPGVLVKLFVDIIIDPISAPIDVNAFNRARLFASPFRIFFSFYIS